ncbi:MAG TPA: flavohemoprotein, partial [Pseudonocardia sp.]|nr:flavohemoprotein [Pseudonocardia sp.]
MNRNAELVRSSYVAVAPRLDKIIARFYAVLFTTAPSVRSMFPINMQSQRGRLARVLNHVVGALDRPEDLAPFL